MQLKTIIYQLLYAWIVRYSSAERSILTKIYKLLRKSYQNLISGSICKNTMKSLTLPVWDFCTGGIDTSLWAIADLYKELWHLWCFDVSLTYRPYLYYWWHRHVIHLFALWTEWWLLNIIIKLCLWFKL